MKKILISDFYGTLVSIYSGTINIIYGTRFGTGIRNELQAFLYAFSKVQDDLEEFLKEGNELVIVTDAGHESPEFMCKTFFNELYKRFPEYSSQIKIFFKAAGPDNYIINSLKCNKDGNTFFYDAGLYKAIIVADKMDVFDYLDTKDKELYSIGDTENDLDMLFKNIELGGISALIDYNLLFSRSDYERDAINCYSVQKASLYADVNSRVNLDLNQNTREARKKMFYQKIKYFNKEITQMINAGEITHKGAYAISGLYKVIDSHAMHPDSLFSKPSPYFPSVNLDQLDEWIDQDKLQVHNSFNEFNQKVLNKR